MMCYYQNNCVVTFQNVRTYAVIIEVVVVVVVRSGQMSDVWKAKPRERELNKCGRLFISRNFGNNHEIVSVVS